MRQVSVEFHENRISLAFGKHQHYECVSTFRSFRVGEIRAPSLLLNFPPNRSVWELTLVDLHSANCVLIYRDA
jgi:hypothetical protein